MIRLGLIGAGPWGRNYIRTIAAMKDMVIARVASRNPETNAIVPAGCRVSFDWREVAQAPDLDGVIIATPPALHAEMAMAAVQADLPVLVEKPLTMDLAQARELQRAARRRGGFVLVDHIYLFHPVYAAIRRRAEELGGPRSVVSIGGNRGPLRPDVPPLWDYAPHDVALCLDLFQNRPRRVQAERLKKGRGELIRIALDFPGHGEARIETGNARTKRRRRLEVVCGDHGKRRELLVFDDTRPLPPAARELPLARALESFAAAIRTGSRDRTSLDLGVDVVEVLERCARLL